MKLMRWVFLMQESIREIFNSDDESFGGTGIKNSGVQKAKKEEKDERPYSIKIQAALFPYRFFL